jgi:hypothetical protein
MGQYRAKGKKCTVGQLLVLYSLFSRVFLQPPTSEVEVVYMYRFVCFQDLAQVLAQRTRS